MSKSTSTVLNPTELPIALTKGTNVQAFTQSHPSAKYKWNIIFLVLKKHQNWQYVTTFFLAHKLYKNSLFSLNQDFYASQWHLNPLCYRGVSSWIQHSSCAFFILQMCSLKHSKTTPLDSHCTSPRHSQPQLPKQWSILHITGLSRKPFSRETETQKIIEKFFFSLL